MEPTLTRHHLPTSRYMYVSSLFGGWDIIYWLQHLSNSEGYMVDAVALWAASAPDRTSCRALLQSREPARLGVKICISPLLKFSWRLGDDAVKTHSREPSRIRGGGGCQNSTCIYNNGWMTVNEHVNRKVLYDFYANNWRNIFPKMSGFWLTILENLGQYNAWW